jgi:hypothetical protein
VSCSEELSRETLRLYGRYATEVIERFDLCPWARGAREAGRVALRVVSSTDPADFSSSLEVIDALARQRDADIGLVIYPLLDLERAAFEDFVRRLRSASRAAQPDSEQEFATAAFHPLAEPDVSHPDRLVPFIRKSPDPTLQLVRWSVLNDIKNLTSGTAYVDLDQLGISGFSSLEQAPQQGVRERIGTRNLATIRELGSQVLQDTFRDIAADRERAHQTLAIRHGVRGPSWLARMGGAPTAGSV